MVVAWLVQAEGKLLCLLFFSLALECSPNDSSSMLDYRSGSVNGFDARLGTWTGVQLDATALRRVGSSDDYVRNQES